MVSNQDLFYRRLFLLLSFPLLQIRQMWKPIQYIVLSVLQGIYCFQNDRDQLIFAWKTLLLHIQHDWWQLFPFWGQFYVHRYQNQVKSWGLCIDFWMIGTYNTWRFLFWFDLFQLDYRNSSKLWSLALAFVAHLARDLTGFRGWRPLTTTLSQRYWKLKN